MTSTRPAASLSDLTPRRPMVVVRLLADGEPQYRVRSELTGWIVAMASPAGALPRK